MNSSNNIYKLVIQIYRYRYGRNTRKCVFFQCLHLKQIHINNDQVLLVTTFQKCAFAQRKCVQSGTCIEGNLLWNLLRLNNY